MSRLTTPDAGLVVWGWYSIALLAAPVGAGAPGLVRREGERAFWCAWWTEDPRRSPGALPDAYGIIEGCGFLFGEAVGAADRAIRGARGQRAYALGLDGGFAIAAYRDGAPRSRATGQDFAAMAAQGYAALGLAPGASPQELARAFAALHPDHGGAPDADMDRLGELYRAARADARRRHNDEALRSILAGARPAAKRQRPGAGPLLCSKKAAK